MPRHKEPYRLTSRNGVFYYKLPAGKWRTTGARERGAAVQYIMEHYGIEAKPKPTTRPTVTTLAAFLEPYYTARCPYIGYRQSKDQRAIRRFSKTHVVRSRALIDKFILKDAIAGMLLADVTSADVEAFQLRLIESKLGPRRVNQTVGVLKTCLSDAGRRGLFDRKITVSNIRYDEQPTGVYSLDQLQAMFAAVPGPFTDRQVQTYFLLLATTGCRRGEALAVRWKSLDLATGTMQIVEALREGKEVAHPKWGKGRKDVALPLFVVDRLREYRRECYHVLPDGFCFSRPDGQPYGGGWVTGHFRTMQKKTGFRVDAEGHRLTVHAFRHTYNTILIKQGMTADAVRAIIGWSDPAIQQRYSHLTAGDYQQGAKIIEDIFAKKA